MTTRYTKDHEYIRLEGDTGIVGITDYAQAQLGDVVYRGAAERRQERRRRAPRRPSSRA